MLHCLCSVIIYDIYHYVYRGRLCIGHQGLYTTWREMDGSTRRHYRQLSSRAIEAISCPSRHHSFHYWTMVIRWSSDGHDLDDLGVH